MTDLSQVSFSLRRTGCYGSCIPYTLQVYGDGSVTYKSEARAAVQGTHTDHISTDAVQKLLRAFRDADFFSLDNVYSMAVTDVPSYFVGIKTGADSKSIEDYEGLEVGMPDSVRDLQDATDEVAESSRWTTGTRLTVPSLRREGFDFKSKEAGAILARCALIGDEDAVHDLILAGAPLDGLDPQGRSILVSAAATRKLSSVREILVHAKTVPVLKESENAALASAVRRSDFEIADLLIRNGASAKDPAVLIGAASSGSPRLVSRILTEHVNVNAQDKNGNTALQAAVQANSEDADVDRLGVVKLLLKARPNLDAQDVSGNTALHKTTDEDVAKILIQSGANINLQNHDGETPLMATFSESLARVLVGAGADLTVRSKQGKTALDIAHSHNQTAVVQLIEQAEAARLKNK